MRIKYRKMIGKISQELFPSYSSCKRCGITWNLVKEHSTKYNNNMGCFPLCEDCWQELETPENRIPYYEMLLDNWKEISYDGEDDNAIIEAVKKGR